MKNKEYVGVEDNSKDILYGIMVIRWLMYFQVFCLNLKVEEYFVGEVIKFKIFFMLYFFFGIDVIIEEICNK